MKKVLLFLMTAILLIACSKTECCDGFNSEELTQVQKDYQKAFTRSLTVSEDGTWVAPTISVVNSIDGCTIEDLKIVLRYEDQKVSEISEGSVSIGEYKVATFYAGAIPYAKGTTLQWVDALNISKVKCFNTADVSYNVKMKNGYSIPVKLSTKTPSNILESKKLEIIIKASGSITEFESDRIILHSGLHPITYEVTVSDWTEVENPQSQLNI